MSYGIPYKGSKNRIAQRICNIFPNRKNLYDLFCGGCAITHCAMVHNQFQHYVINDISPIPVNIFVDAINGKFEAEKRWISRDDFKQLKDDDMYVLSCYSYGYNFKNYCYGRQIYPYKMACHYAIVFDDWQQFKKLCPQVVDYVYNVVNKFKTIKQRRIAFGHATVQKLKQIGDWDIVQKNPLYKSCKWRGCKLNAKGSTDLQALQSLENLERLQNIGGLKSLQSLGNLEYHIGDYRNIAIQPNSVVYCDIPYQDTQTYYNQQFDYDDFYCWCQHQQEPVIISSYNMPDDRFDVIDVIPHRNTFSSQKKFKVLQKLFIPKHQAKYLDLLF